MLLSSGLSLLVNPINKILKFALPFPKLFHGSNTSPWQDQWLSLPSLRAHHPFSFGEVRRTSASTRTCCCCCLSVVAHYVSVLPLDVVYSPALRMQPGVRLSGFILWHPPHPAVCRPLSDVTVWNESMKSAWYRLPLHVHGCCWRHRHKIKKRIKQRMCDFIRTHMMSFAPSKSINTFVFIILCCVVCLFVFIWSGEVKRPFIFWCNI